MTLSPGHIEIAPFGDAAALAALHAACFERPWTEESFSGLLAVPGTCALGALLDETPAGLILTRQAADEAEILTIGVVPQARRQGVASALFHAALAQMGDVRSVFIEVDVDNTNAIEFYEQHQFQIGGRRTAYYRHADGTTSDALIMRHDVGGRPKD